MENKERIAFLEKLIRDDSDGVKNKSSIDGIKSAKVMKWYEDEYPNLYFTIYIALQQLDDADFDKLLKEVARLLDEPLRLYFLDVAVKDLLEPTQYLVKDNQHLVKDTQNGK